MNNSELTNILSKRNVAIIAAAGHGKTEMIAEMVKNVEGKQLLLTHTNAGVAALKNRLKKKKIPSTKYAIYTIAGFCQKWCMAYRFSANIDMSLSKFGNRDEKSKYYDQFYAGASKLFTKDFALRVLQNSYAGVFVDEYQDCTNEQHSIFVNMNNVLPVRVLGDPLQGILSFAGNLVDWSTIEFEIININGEPWRWKNTNIELGLSLETIREKLAPSLEGEECVFDEVSDNIVIIPASNLRKLTIWNEIKGFNSTVYITKWEYQQKKFCLSTGGVFQYDEKQDCDDLYRYARTFDKEFSPNQLVLEIMEFYSQCATQVKLSLLAYENRMKNNSWNFSRIKSFEDFGRLLVELQYNDKFNILIKLLEWFSISKDFNIYRRELLSEMIRSIHYAKCHNISIYDASEIIRLNGKTNDSYNHYKYLSSRPALCKGLEFDCVIIDMTPDFRGERMSVKDFYVSLTRAKKKIYIVSDTNELIFAPDEQLPF